MKAKKENITPHFFKAWKLLGMAVLFLLVSQIAYAQNTKGADVKNGSKAKSESRFRIPTKKKKQKSNASSYKRVQGRPGSLANSARKTPSTKPQKIYSQGGRGVNYRSKSDKQKAWRGDITGRRIRAPRSNEKVRNVYPQYGRYTSNPSRKPKNKEPKAISNRPNLRRLDKLQGGPSNSGSGKRKQVVIPRSASHSFIARKSINVYANFPRPKPKKEKAHTKDITGRRLRSKNFETPKPKLATPTYKPYYGRKRIGDKSYQGKAAGSHQSISQGRQHAWKGNISGNKIRGRNYSSKPRVEGHPIFPKMNRRPQGRDRRYSGSISPTAGNRSATRPGESRTGKSPLPVRTPGAGASRAGTYQGSIKLFGRSSKRFTNQGEGFSGYKKAKRPLTRGGSVSGRLWNNKGSALPGRTPKPGAARAGTYQGSIKIFGKSTAKYGDQGESFSGYIKARKPLVGGGSASGRSWNNKGSALPVRTPKPSAARAGNYQGSLKVLGRSTQGMRDQGEGFTGYKKATRPVKGGGSVSGRLWNNKEKPLPVRVPPPAAQRAGTFQGNAKLFEQNPTMQDQGEEFTGFIKLRKFKKNYVKNPNSAEAALKKKHPSKSTYSVDGLQVKVKERDYVQNKNAAKESLLKKKPTKSTYLVDGLQVRVKQREYGKKPKAAEGSMPGVKPTKSSVKASEYASGVKRTWKYIHNPSSADAAMKTREPGKAFGRSTDYQGNIKMQKFHLFEKNRHLHPDATFVKTNKNNVDGERDLLTNVKLWWAKVFKKQDTQPENLKDKGKRPRYDKREDGLWND